MAALKKETCLRCRGDIFFNGLDSLVKCTFCGSVFAITEFQSEAAKLQEKIEESERTQVALEQQKKERDEVIRRLSSEVEQTRASIDAFQGQWRATQLDEADKLYRQAEAYQRDREFDLADTLLQKLIIRGYGDIEVSWRRVLCHYGVEYQADGDKWVPTLLQPDLMPPEDIAVRREFDSFLKNATEAMRTHYESELKYIDDTLDSYRLMRHEAAYDVFICVRQQQDGHRTTDSDIASELYDQIREMGLKVFNSRRTVLLAGQAFEPRIIAALMSSKVMIVVGTSAENMESQWVKNEWSRFQWLQKHDKETRRTLICYLAGNMCPEKLPRALNPNVQAIIDGIAAYNQLKANLENLFPERFMRKESPIGPKGSETFGQSMWREVAPTSQQCQPNAECEYAYSIDKSDNQKNRVMPSPEALIVQMRVWLMQGNYQRVLENYQGVVDSGMDASNAELHLCALCAIRRVADFETLARTVDNLETEPLFSLAADKCVSQRERMMLDALIQKNRAAQSSERLATQPDIGNARAVYFGQWSDPAGGKRPLEWLVLNTEDGNATLLCRYGIEGVDDSSVNAIWECNGIRRWLKEDFSSIAFTSKERMSLRSVRHSPDEAFLSRAQRRETRDSVFLLSSSEVEQYLDNSQSRACLIKGVDGKPCRWWLRSPGIEKGAAFVEENGEIIYSGMAGREKGAAVRPAIKILTRDLDRLKSAN